MSIALVPLSVAASGSELSVETVQVTATKTPEALGTVPADVSLTTRDELDARDVHDLAGAFALTAGVEAPPGGDAGPSSAVPSLWGLHEFDAFLLLVDGVPFGGAFNPSIATLNFTDVERIEVMRGPAPVLYGATSFVGVVNLLHFPAGESSDAAELAAGSYTSVRGELATALPLWRGYRQSVALDGQTVGFADKREAVRDGHVLYRGSVPLGSGMLEIDTAATLLRDVPPSPTVREGNALTVLTGRNANFNPADARIDENSFQLALNYVTHTALGAWDTRISSAHSEVSDIRGFLRPSLTDDGTPNADSQNQRRRFDDLYIDSHVSRTVAKDFDIIAGADLLYGQTWQKSRNGEYFVPLDGSAPAPRTTSLHIDEVNTVADHRAFAGQYGNLDWQPGPRWDLTVGLRLNEVSEHKRSAHLDGFDPAADLSALATRITVRFSEAVGATYRIPINSTDFLALYADYRSAFKPGAIDFGPDYTPDILEPESARSIEAGAKLTLDHVNLQAEAYHLNFGNLVVALPDATLVNGGRERLEGAELEARWYPVPDLGLVANLSYHDSRFKRSPLGFAGRQLTLAPRVLASAGVLLEPDLGLQASATVDYVGDRFLDEANTARASPYATLAAVVGYKFRSFSIIIDGKNLTNVRPPVTQSEFGSSSYYLLAARSISVRLRVNLDGK